jgi:hypothetical protein
MATVHPASLRNGHRPQIGLPEDGIIAIGELLRRAREHRGLTSRRSRDQAASAPPRGAENDNLAVMPAGFYQRAEIRTHARAVGLDQDLLVSQLDSMSRPVGTRARCATFKDADAYPRALH